MISVVLVLVCGLYGHTTVSNAFQFAAEEKECPDFVDPRIFYHEGTQVSPGTPMRAHHTVPHDFQIAPSSIPRAGLGIFTNTFIKTHTWLGEYEGEFLPQNYTYSSRGCEVLRYSWEINVNLHPAYIVDAKDIRLSNWLRFINCARNLQEENVMSVSCFGRIYYRTHKDIPPGKELLVYYGHSYARLLGIDTTEFQQRQQTCNTGNYCMT